MVALTSSDSVLPAGLTLPLCSVKLGSEESFHPKILPVASGCWFVHCIEFVDRISGQAKDAEDEAKVISDLCRSLCTHTFGRNHKC